MLLAESQRSNIDHCLALAQAEVESDFHQDTVGSAGEAGIFGAEFSPWGRGANTVH